MGRRLPANDADLCQEVRTHVLGRHPFRRFRVLVDACGGVVGLRGVVDGPATAEALVAAVAERPGVVAVRDHLVRAP